MVEEPLNEWRRKKSEPFFGIYSVLEPSDYDWKQYEQECGEYLSRLESYLNEKNTYSEYCARVINYHLFW
jgi:hypothetical protein